MRLREQLKKGLQAWQPSKYRSLSAHHMRDWLRILAVWLVICLLLMLIVGIPRINSFGDRTSEFFDAFTTFTITTDVELNETTVISRQPRIVVSNNQTLLEKERLLVHEEGISYRKPFWQGTKDITWEDITDVKGHATLHSEWLTLLAILLVPSLLVLVAAIFIVEAAVLLLIMPGIILLFSRIFKIRILAKQASKISIIALIPFLMVQVLPLFYVRWLLIPLGLYVLLVIAGIWMLGESKFERQQP